MIDVNHALVIFVFHWIGDFILQSNRVAKGKSEDNMILLEHVFLYSLTIASPAVFIVGSYEAWLGFVLSNAVLHYATDWITSRMSKYFYLDGNRHAFFVTIGFDQLIHSVCLLVTLQIFVTQ